MRRSESHKNGECAQQRARNWVNGGRTHTVRLRERKRERERGGRLISYLAGRYAINLPTDPTR